jgi:cephalosporin-C deacetylase-like acetyl esterase
VVLFFLGPVTIARGQEAPGDAMIKKYLDRETDRLGTRFLDGAKTLAEWQKRRPQLKQQYFEMLGLWPLPEKTPLKATITGTVERGNVVIEKLHYQSRPGLYVTANLYRPRASRERKRPEKRPAVLYVCGHSGRGRDGNKTAFQDHGMWFAQNGYVCLIVDTLQLGEIAGVHHGTYSKGRWWWQARGYTPAGVECWNGVRGIDYLVSRPDVDPERIAVTGISGGGAATVWIAAADERVKCAVPVSGMSDLESYVKHKVINGHCDCMFLVNTYAWEWTTIAALIAPRPLLFANSDNDPIFPMDGNRRIIARLRKVYEMYGKPKLVDDYVSKGGHDYRSDLRLAIFKWINRHVKGDTAPVKDVDSKPLPGKELRVFPADKDIPKDALNGKIDETFVPKAAVKLPVKGKFEEWKKGLMKELREKSFRTFPDRIPKAEAGLTIREGNGTLVRMRTEPVITAELFFFAKGKQDPKLGKVLVLNADGLMSASDGELIYSVQLRGGTPNEWTRKSPPNYVERANALLGRTVDQGRVWDVAAAVRLLAAKENAPKQWRVEGQGRAGVIAAYAALFEPSISEVVIVNPPASHRDGPIFLNVLRVLDVPEALGMLAPRPLTLVNADEKLVQRVAKIYELAGAKDKFKHRRSPSR